MSEDAHKTPESAEAKAATQSRSPWLDEMLDADSAASWLKISRRELLDKSRGRKPVVPGFHIGPRTLRFHPRTIIACLATREGVDPQTIAASMVLTAKARHD